MDTSVLVNCSNGLVLAVVFQLPNRTFIIPPAVVTEFSVGDLTALQDALASGHAAILNESEVPGALYLKLLDEWGLGEGETECIAYASHAGIHFSSDDGLARRRATELLGADHVSGSLRLLKEAVEESLLTNEDAFAAYERMRAAGGFLPVILKEFFDE
jgi:predicted nucleic acid-binding protein